MKGYISACVVGLVAVFAFAMWGLPQYNVYSQRLAGTASYERADQDRKVRILESQAKLESNKLDAMAEVERAKGVAQANTIIAESLSGPAADGYLRWRTIEMMEATHNQLIYIPTEAMLPILEAGRRGSFGVTP